MKENLTRLMGEISYLLMKLGMWHEARVLLDGLTGLRPDHPTVGLLNGIVAFATGRYREAEKHYQRILAHDPQNPVLQAYLGETLIAQQRWREAEDILTRVVHEQRDPWSGEFARQLLEGLKSGIFQRFR